MFIIILGFFSQILGGQIKKTLEIEITNDSIFFFKNDFENNLLKEIIPKKIEINYYLVNNSKNTYAIFVDPNNYLVYENTDVKKYFFPRDDLLRKQIFQPAIIIKDNKGEITDTGFSIEKKYFDNLPELSDNIEKLMIYIKPFSKHPMKAYISLPILNNNLDNGIFSSQYFLGISLNGLEQGKLSMLLLQDKKIIQKALNRKFKKKIIREGIYIYDGKIESNTVIINVN